MSDKEKYLLDLIEELLSITEEHIRNTQQWRSWQKISAIEADLALHPCSSSTKTHIVGSCI